MGKIPAPRGGQHSILAKDARSGPVCRKGIMIDSGYYSESELSAIGFLSIGDKVLVSRRASIYGAASISIGSNVRIDDFCVITAGREPVVIGDYVHIAHYSGLFGSGGITLEDFSGLSSRVSVYSASDDYSGASLTNPTVPSEFVNVHSSPVVLRRHVIVGATTVVLPGVEIGEGAAVGAMSLVTKDLPPWGIYAGAPARRIKERSRRVLDLEVEVRARGSAG